MIVKQFHLEQDFLQVFKLFLLMSYVIGDLPHVRFEKLNCFGRFDVAVLWVDVISSEKAFHCPVFEIFVVLNPTFIYHRLYVLLESSCFLIPREHWAQNYLDFLIGHFTEFEISYVSCKSLL